MNAAVAQELWKGQTIDGKFPLLEWLGGSTHSAVFRTQLPGSSMQPAAIKLVRADRPDAAQQIAAWRGLVTLSHSHLLRIFHAGHCQMSGAPWLYVVTEYAEENVDQVLPVRPLSMTEVGELLPPVIESLSFLHSKHLVHGRLKPSNICAVKNQLKLTTDSVHPAAQPFTPYSLTAYDAPESESGRLPPAADMWSLGMTLVAAFDQRPLTWSRSNTVDPVVPKSIPAPYAQIARECLRMNPEDRCTLSRLRDLVHQAPPLPKPPVPKATGRKKVVAPLIAVLVVGAVIFAVRSKHSTPSEPAVVAPAEQQVPPAEQPTTNSADQKPTAYAPKTDAAVPPAVTHESSPKPPVRVVESVPTTPGVVNQVLPQVPLSARETIHGKVRVKVQVQVGPNGDVSDASFISPGPSRYFARLAMEASRQWKFQPGQPTPAHWVLEYRFGRTSTEVTPVAVPGK
ncbi:MAG TPA: TonB family protein [Terriglobales bacterium]|nr:TonB family protein [Terriglobales bacterium]